MSSVLREAETKVTAAVESGPAEQIRRSRARPGLSCSQRLGRSLVRGGMTLVLLAALAQQIVAPVDTPPSLELRRVLVILVALVGWLACSWRGMRHDYARNAHADRV